MNLDCLVGVPTVGKYQRMGFRGVLFDSGGVLTRPVGGRWNPRHDFEDVLARHHPDLDPAAFPAAFAAGQQALDEAAGTFPRDDYHRVILRALGVASPSAGLLAELTAPLPGPPIEPFPEVPRVLERLRSAGIPMAIVSDAWPELTALYEQLGLRHYFATIVISAVLGCRKPDPRMYAAGSDGLGLAPGECLFIDDDPQLVAAAVALGYGGAVMCRDEGPRPPGAMSTLEDVPALVTG